MDNGIFGIPVVGKENQLQTLNVACPKCPAKNTTLLYEAKWLVMDGGSCTNNIKQFFGLLVNLLVSLDYCSVEQHLHFSKMLKIMKAK